MEITREEVLRIARIARIAIADDEIELYRKQLQDILSYSSCVTELAATLENSDLHKNSNIFREDKVTGFNPQDILDRAPDAQDSYFVVPRILEEIKKGS